MARIEVGREYRHCDVREDIRVRVTGYTDGDARADVVDAGTGKRPRRILVKDLHESPITATGRRRRTGYVLERRGTPRTEPAAEPAAAVRGALEDPAARDIATALDAAGAVSGEQMLRRFYAGCMERAADLVAASVPPATAGPLTEGDRRLRDAAAVLRREATLPEGHAS